MNKELSNMGDWVDVVHLNGVWRFSNWVAGNWAANHQKKLVITVQGSLLPWPLGQTRFKRFKKWIVWQLYAKRNFAMAACLHVTSQYELKAIRSFGITSPVALIPNGVAPSEFKPVSGCKRLDSRYPYLKGKRVLLFLSRIHPVKGLLNLASAWGELAGDFPEWHLVVAGPDNINHWKQVEQVLLRQGVGERCTFTGELTGEWRLAAYHSAQLFVLPTLSESFGTVVAEALAAELPVITTKGAPWRDLMDFRCGWWIEGGIAPLKEALRQAMSLGQTELTAMGKRGKNLVMNKYNWRTIAERMIEVYDWVLSGGPLPDCVHVC